MAEIIKDGTGTGYTAKVDLFNRAHVDAVQRTHASDASIEGLSFNLNTGIVNLTSANESAIIYYESNEDNIVIIESLFYLIGNSTNGSGDMLVSVYRNPTAFSTSTNVDMCGNRNFGSSRALAGNAYKGAEAATQTGGVKIIESIFNQSATRSEINVGTIVLNKGNSIAITLTPATGNTSLDVEIAIALHVEPAL